MNARWLHVLGSIFLVLGCATESGEAGAVDDVAGADDATLDSVAGDDAVSDGPADEPDVNDTIPQPPTDPRYMGGCLQVDTTKAMESPAKALEAWLQDTVRLQVSVGLFESRPPGRFVEAFEAALVGRAPIAPVNLDPEYVLSLVANSEAGSEKWSSDVVYGLFAQGANAGSFLTVGASGLGYRLVAPDSGLVRVAEWMDEIERMGRTYTTNMQIVAADGAPMSFDPTDPEAWYIGLRDETDWEMAVEDWIAEVPDGMAFLTAIEEVPIQTQWAADGFGPHWDTLGATPVPLEEATVGISLVSALSGEWWGPSGFDYGYRAEVRASQQVGDTDLTMQVVVNADARARVGAQEVTELGGTIVEQAVDCQVAENFSLDVKGFMLGDVLCRVPGLSDGHDPGFTFAYREEGAGGGILYWCPELADRTE